MIACLLVSLALGPAFATSPDPELAAWEQRTGGALVLDEATRLEPGQGGSLVVAGAGTSLFLLLETGEGATRKALDAQIRPFTQAGIPAPTVAEVSCTVAGQAGQPARLCPPAISIHDDADVVGTMHYLRMT